MYLYFLMITMTGDVPGKVILDMPSITVCEAQREQYQSVFPTSELKCLRVRTDKVQI